MPKNSLERKCDKEPLVFNTLHASTGQAPPRLLQIGHLGLLFCHSYAHDVRYALSFKPNPEKVGKYLFDRVLRL